MEMDVKLTKSGNKLIEQATFGGPPVSKEALALPIYPENFYEMYVKLPNGDAIVVIVSEDAVKNFPEYFNYL